MDVRDSYAQYKMACNGDISWTWKQIESFLLLSEIFLIEIDFFRT